MVNDKATRRGLERVITQYDITGDTAQLIEDILNLTIGCCTVDQLNECAESMCLRVVE